MTGVQLFFCGSIRGYHRVHGDEHQVALFAHEDGAKQKLRSRYFSTYIADPRAAIADSLYRLLDNPKGFPLKGLHWHARSCGGPGPVLTEDSPATSCREDLQELQKIGWDV